MGKLHLQIYYKIEKNDICTTLYLHKIYKARQKFANPEHMPYLLILRWTDNWAI